MATTAMKLTPVQLPIQTYAYGINTGRRLNIFDIDGATYMTCVAYNGVALSQEFWLWKYKSKKIGFAKYQNLKAADGLPNANTICFPQVNCQVPATVKMGKITYLLSSQKVLLPFAQSSDPILRRAGKQLATNMTALSGTKILPGSLQPYPNSATVRNAVLNFKCGSNEYYLNPDYQQVAYSSSGYVYPQGQTGPALNLYIYDKKQDALLLSQRLDLDVPSEVSQNGKAFSRLGEQVSGSPYADYHGWYGWYGYGYYTVPSKNYQVFLVDNKSEKYIKDNL